jgi:hypothetical protein
MRVKNKGRIYFGGEIKIIEPRSRIEPNWRIKQMIKK